MKVLTIALKDFLRSYRSVFALVFMFGMPLLITGMFYFMFGNTKSSAGFDLPRTKVIVANLDEGNPQTGQIGQEVVKALQSQQLSALMEVTTTTSAAAARQAVADQLAGVAVIIPASFSASFADANIGAGDAGATEIQITQDPTLTIGPSIVRSVLNQITDNLAGVKIAVSLALKRAEAGEIGYDQISPLVAQYTQAVQTGSDPAARLLDVRSPAAAPQKNTLAIMIGSIMGGMLIFYAFFTGMSTGQSILREEEEGTLPRLFTTPTTQAEILGGKFLAIGFTVLVQVCVLLLAAHLIFGIQWGALPVVALYALATIATASTFGLMVNSFLKSAKQGGVIFGGLLTVTGMVGMLDIFTGNPGSSQFGILPLFTPQGWAARSMFATMNGATAADILPNVLAPLAMSVVFFLIGVWRFQRRYA